MTHTYRVEVASAAPSPEWRDIGQMQRHTGQCLDAGVPVVAVRGTPLPLDARAELKNALALAGVDDVVVLCLPAGTDLVRLVPITDPRSP